jgi:recombination protein U
MAKNRFGFVFENEIKRSATKYDFFSLKVVPPAFKGFARASICDFLMIYNGVPIGIEAKAQGTPSAWNFDLVKPHQVDALLSIHNAGGRAFVLINFRGKSLCTYVLPIKTYIRLKEEYLKSGRKSIPLKDFDNLKTLSRDKNPITYDLRVLIEDSYYEK